MKNLFVSGAMAVALGLSFGARAAVIDYSCDGGYDSKKAYDPFDPSSVAIRAHVDARMSDEGAADRKYTLAVAEVSLIAVNLKNADAGSVAVTDVAGKANAAHKSKYKDYLRFDLGSIASPVYPNAIETPETYLLLPMNDSKVIYIQRTGSGHDSFPTIRLLCR